MKTRRAPGLACGWSPHRYSTTTAQAQHMHSTVTAQPLSTEARRNPRRARGLAHGWSHRARTAEEGSNSSPSQEYKAPGSSWPPRSAQTRQSSRRTYGPRPGRSGRTPPRPDDNTKKETKAGREQKGHEIDNAPKNMKDGTWKAVSVPNKLTIGKQDRNRGYAVGYVDGLAEGRWRDRRRAGGGMGEGICVGIGGGIGVGIGGVGVPPWT